MSSTSNQSLLSSVSEPENNHRRSCTDMSTQTDFSTNDESSLVSHHNIPSALRRRKSATNTSQQLGAGGEGINQSRIPRPVMQRSKTLDSIPTSSKLKRRNSSNSGSCASRQQQLNNYNNNINTDSNKAGMPRALRDKAGQRPSVRREKSDLTGQRSKHRTANSPGPVRRNGKINLTIL